MLQGEERGTSRGLSLGTKIFIGVLFGIGAGVFFGDLVAPLQVVGEIYIGLLQMTVLPYITVSLISKVGAFTYDQASEVAGRAIKVQLGLWAIALVMVVLFPLTLPDWEAGAFFSASLVEEAEAFDFLGLYLPTNPFASLADEVVPAVVVFSILLGVALISLENKDRLLGPLEVIGDALGAIARWVVALSPWGTFALAAAATGTSSPSELARVGGYVSSFTIGCLLLGFVVFPAVVASVTPFGYRAVVGQCRGTLLTAFATGKMFAVLPMIIDDVRALLRGEGMNDDEAEDAAGVLVPLSYPFPNAGKILGVLFISFAAWFVGQPLGWLDYPLLLSVGVLSFFGSPVAAIPFLLGLYGLPADLLTLFLLAGIWCARVGDLLGVMHLTAFSLLTTASQRGWLRLRPGAALGWGLGSILTTAVALGVNSAVVSWSISGEPPPANRVEAMEAYFDDVEVAEDDTGEANPTGLLEGESALDRIRRSGDLRVGYVSENAPFSYRNAAGSVVGLDIDLASRLARELGVSLVLVSYEPESLGTAFETDRFDLAVGGLGSFVEESSAYRESAPYLSLNGALLVPDRDVEGFDDLADLRRRRATRIGYVEGGVLVRTGRHRIPGLDLVQLDSDEDYLEGRVTGIDALLTTAEAGAISTMIFPAYSVVVPEGFRVGVPVVFGVRPDPTLERAVDRFLRIKQEDGTVGTLYDHWILGAPDARAAPRWSIVRDVLGWID